MKQNLINTQVCLGIFFLFSLSACFEKKTVSIKGPTLPPAVPGNRLISAQDEAPIIRDKSGQPLRSDREVMNCTDPSSNKKKPLKR